MAVVLVGKTNAQDATTNGLQQPAAVQQTADSHETYLPFTTSDGTNAPASDPQPPTTEKASEKPADQATEKKDGEAKKADEKKDEEEKKDEDEDTGFKLFKGPWLECHHIDVRGLA